MVQYRTKIQHNMTLNRLLVQTKQHRNIILCSNVAFACWIFKIQTIFS